MTMVGAGTARLADLATEFGDAAEELDKVARRLVGSIERADSWQGPSADRCKHEWTALAHRHFLEDDQLVHHMAYQ